MLVSHMRGHICRHGSSRGHLRRRRLALVEDCAHTMGARWAAAPSGSWGWQAASAADLQAHELPAKAACSSPTMTISGGAAILCRAATCSTAARRGAGRRRFERWRARRCRTSSAHGQSARRHRCARSSSALRSAPALECALCRPWRTSSPARRDLDCREATRGRSSSPARSSSWSTCRRPSASGASSPGARRAGVHVKWFGAANARRVHQQRVALGLFAAAAWCRPVTRDAGAALRHAHSAGSDGRRLPGHRLHRASGSGHDVGRSLRWVAQARRSFADLAVDRLRCRVIEKHHAVSRPVRLERHAC